MTDIQLFNHPEFGSIHAVEMNDEPWFVGKDIAAAPALSTPLTGSFKRSPYWRLRGWFRQLGLLDQEVCQAVGMNAQTFSRRMRGTQPWLSSEITSICKALGIPQEQIGAYFFPDISPVNDEKEDV
nr:MAG TPA: Regulatory protein-modification, helix-turn-helix, transcriptional regulato, DNA [Caudoviricetes sp.]